MKSQGRWTLNPCGNLWAKDQTSFGHKLLSKMGWKKGKGLGKNENGISENIKIKVKGSNKGIGWGEKPDIGIHHDEYSALLSSLNNTHSNGTASSDGSEVDHEDSKVNLELQSKFLKNRLHYQKFIRGKNVSQYSEKDMESIFGHKISKDSAKHAVDIDGLLEKGNKNVPCESSVPTYNGSMTISDYFEQKMKAKMEKTNTEVEECSQKADANDTVETEPVSSKRKRKKSKHHSSKKLKLQELKSCLKDPSSAPHEKKEVVFSENISFYSPENSKDDISEDLEQINQNTAEVDTSNSPEVAKPVGESTSIAVATTSNNLEHSEPAEANKSAKLIKLSTELKTFAVKSNYDSWLQSQRQAMKMKCYKNINKKIKKHHILRTTNLAAIKGYGNW